MKRVILVLFILVGSVYGVEELWTIEARCKGSNIIATVTYEVQDDMTYFSGCSNTTKALYGNGYTTNNNNEVSSVLNNFICDNNIKMTQDFYTGHDQQIFEHHSTLDFVLNGEYESGLSSDWTTTVLENNVNNRCPSGAEAKIRIEPQFTCKVVDSSYINDLSGKSHTIGWYGFEVQGVEFLLKELGNNVAIWYKDDIWVPLHNAKNGERSAGKLFESVVLSSDKKTLTLGNAYKTLFSQPSSIVSLITNQTFAIDRAYFKTASGNIYKIQKNAQRYSIWNYLSINELMPIHYAPTTDGHDAACKTFSTISQSSTAVEIDMAQSATSSESSSSSQSSSSSSSSSSSQISNNRVLPVLKTGQIQSYATYDDGYYQKGRTRSYSRSGEIVTDHITHLQWQDDSEAKTEIMSWDKARSYCSSKSLGGFSDWRLPSSVELESIVDYGRINPAIDTSYFNNLSSDYYWSATTIQDYSEFAWIVDFYYGGVGRNDKDVNNYVRCVRAGQ